MYRQACQLFLFLHKNVIPLPPLPLTASIELMKHITTISQYLPTAINRLSPTTSVQVNINPLITQPETNKHQTEDKSSKEKRLPIRK
mmetsp:Transcript_19310/g.23902  ORF Transcript_19310/g.23902 Transcript_19310/m.23902 type:complete len:87 (-) Transcript_19310:753-1013(-)